MTLRLLRLSYSSPLCLQLNPPASFAQISACFFRNAHIVVDVSASLPPARARCGACCPESLNMSSRDGEDR